VGWNRLESLKLFDIREAEDSVGIGELDEEPDFEMKPTLQSKYTKVDEGHQILFIFISTPLSGTQSIS